MASRLAVLALFVLAGCAGSPPLYVHTETGRSYGYSETQLSNTQYRVAYRAPRVSTRTPSRIERERRGHERLALAYDLALWRAADVALQLGVPGFAVASRENDVQVEVSLDRPYHHYPFYDPFYYGRRYPYWEPAYRRYDYRYSEIAYIFAEVHLVVDLRDEPGPGAFNAQETLNQMRAKYPNTLARKVLPDMKAVEHSGDVTISHETPDRVSTSEPDSSGLPAFRKLAPS